jgi:hypothetical protein
MYEFFFVVLEFPGTFESYWHFYHMGVRFGRWLGCAVIVDSKDPEKQEVPTVNSVSNNMSVEWHGKWLHVEYTVFSYIISPFFRRKCFYFLTSCFFCLYSALICFSRDKRNAFLRPFLSSSQIHFVRLELLAV